MDLDTFESSFTSDLILCLEKTFDNAPCPVKALMLTNPHNPLGRCYSKLILEQCVKFCHRRDIHFISDEVYALTSFTCPCPPKAECFTSALSLDIEALSCDVSKVHTIWSTSKDLGQSGFRMVRTQFPLDFLSYQL